MTALSPDEAAALDEALTTLVNPSTPPSLRLNAVSIARREVDVLRAELADADAAWSEARARLAAQQPVIDAAEELTTAWEEGVATSGEKLRAAVAALSGSVEADTPAEPCCDCGCTHQHKPDPTLIGGPGCILCRYCSCSSGHLAREVADTPAEPAGLDSLPLAGPNCGATFGDRCIEKGHPEHVPSLEQQAAVAELREFDAVARGIAQRVAEPDVDEDDLDTLRDALTLIEREHERSSDMEAVVDALAAAVVEAGWRPAREVAGTPAADWCNCQNPTTWHPTGDTPSCPSAAAGTPAAEPAPDRDLLGALEESLREATGAGAPTEPADTAPDWPAIFAKHMADETFRDAFHRAEQEYDDAHCSCGGDRWVDDENWSPEYRGDRRQRGGPGRLPCGFCNEGGWDIPDVAGHDRLRAALAVPADDTAQETT